MAIRFQWPAGANQHDRVAQIHAELFFPASRLQDIDHRDFRPSSGGPTLIQPQVVPASIGIDFPSSVSCEASKPMIGQANGLT